MQFIGCAIMCYIFEVGVEVEVEVEPQRTRTRSSSTSTQRNLKQKVVVASTQQQLQQLFQNKCKEVEQKSEEFKEKSN